MCGEKLENLCIIIFTLYFSYTLVFSYVCTSRQPTRHPSSTFPSRNFFKNHILMLKFLWQNEKSVLFLHFLTKRMSGGTFFQKVSIVGNLYGAGSMLSCPRSSQYEDSTSQQLSTFSLRSPSSIVRR